MIHFIELDTSSKGSKDFLLPFFCPCYGRLSSYFIIIFQYTRKGNFLAVTTLDIVKLSRMRAQAQFHSNLEIRTATVPGTDETERRW